jgi:hypothetical protein
MKKLLTSVALMSALGAGVALAPVHAQVFGDGYGYNQGFGGGYGNQGFGNEGFGVGYGNDAYGATGAGFGGDSFWTENDLGYWESDNWATDNFGAYDQDFGWDTADAGFGGWYGDATYGWNNYDDIGDEGWFDV